MKDACQSAGLAPALSPRKLCLVTILAVTGDLPGVFLRSCQLSHKLRCVIGNISEPQARSTWHHSMVMNGCPSSAGAPLRFRALIEGSGGCVVISREKCCPDVHVPLQSPMSSETSFPLLLSVIYACPDGRWSSRIC